MVSNVAGLASNIGEVQMSGFGSNAGTSTRLCNEAIRKTRAVQVPDWPCSDARMLRDRKGGKGKGRRRGV